MADEQYATIRSILGELIGQTVLDVTQHDEDEWVQDGRAYVMIMFADGHYVKFYVGDDGFDHNCGPDDPDVAG